MKVLFIEAVKKKNLNFEQLSQLEKLPGKSISLFYSIQYKKQAEQVKNFLEKNKRKILIFKQVLGCSILSSNIKNSDSILLIGSGRFHALSIASHLAPVIDKEDKEIYIFEQGKLEKISKEEIAKMRNRKKAALSKFYSADEIGIIVSTKLRQQKMNEAFQLKKKLEKKGKKAFIFLADNINTNELENFSCRAWVNTACPGLIFDNANIINIDDIK